MGLVVRSQECTDQNMDRVKLDSCILGKNTQVGSKAELTRCITQAGYEINAGGGG